MLLRWPSTLTRANLHSSFTISLFVNPRLVGTFRSTTLVRNKIETALENQAIWWIFSGVSKLQSQGWLELWAPLSFHCLRTRTLAPSNKSVEQMFISELRENIKQAIQKKTVFDVWGQIWQTVHQEAKDKDWYKNCTNPQDGNSTIRRGSDCPVKHHREAMTKALLPAPLLSVPASSSFLPVIILTPFSPMGYTVLPLQEPNLWGLCLNGDQSNTWKRIFFRSCKSKGL